MFCKNIATEFFHSCNNAAAQKLSDRPIVAKPRQLASRHVKAAGIRSRESAKATRDCPRDVENYVLEKCANPSCSTKFYSPQGREIIRDGIWHDSAITATAIFLVMQSLLSEDDRSHEKRP